MNWAIVFQVAAMLGAGGAVASGARAVVDRKRIKVDNAEVLTGVSIKQVNEMQTGYDALKERMRQYETALWEHQKWDRLVVRQLDKLGAEDVPNPPELWI